MWSPFSLSISFIRLETSRILLLLYLIRPIYFQEGVIANSKYKTSDFCGILKQPELAGSCRGGVVLRTLEGTMDDQDSDKDELQESHSSVFPKSLK